MASFNGSTRCPFSRLHMGLSGGQGVGWCTWALHELDCMLEAGFITIACARFARAQGRRSRVCKPVKGNVACSRDFAFACLRRGEFAKQAKHAKVAGLGLARCGVARAQGPLARADRGTQRVTFCFTFCMETVFVTASFKNFGACGGLQGRVFLISYRKGFTYWDFESAWHSLMTMVIFTMHQTHDLAPSE